MLKTFLAGLIAASFIAVVNASADDKIYQWTDENGVRHFSSDPPADATPVVKTYQPVETPADSEHNQSERRESYNRMVEKQRAESIQNEQERQREQEALEAGKKQQAEQERKAKINAEKEKLQQQIEDLKKRALSPTFPKGMRDSQIESILKKIDELDKR